MLTQFVRDAELKYLRSIKSGRFKKNIKYLENIADVQKTCCDLLI